VITAFDYQKVGYQHFHFLSPFVRDAYLNHINAHSPKAADSNGMGEFEAPTVGFKVPVKAVISQSNESVSEETSDISYNLSSPASDKDSSFATTDVSETTSISLAPIQSKNREKARFQQEPPSDLTMA
jgi:hypothetical protein